MIIPVEVTTTVRASTVRCDRCGAKPGTPCYGNGAMRDPHPSRARTARDQTIAAWARGQALRDAANAATAYDRGGTTELEEQARAIATAITNIPTTE